LVDAISLRAKSLEAHTGTVTTKDGTGNWKYKAIPLL